MSVQAMQWVIEHSAHQGGEFLTLLMLANHAGSEGWECWPSVSFLASECRLSPRQIQRNLRRLEAGGEITMQHSQGPHGTHLYQVLGVTSMTGRQYVTPDASVTGGGDTAMSPQGRHPRHPNRKESSLEPSLRPRKRDPVWDGFAEWLGHLPETKTERGKWNAAAKQLREIGVDSSEDVAARGRRYEQAYPGIVPTPLGLVGHWSELNGSPPKEEQSDPDWMFKFMGEKPDVR